jgi:hypothetical protein
MASVEGIAKKIVNKSIYIFLGFLFGAMSACALVPMAVVAEQHSGIEVDLEKGTLSVHISNRSLASILGIIGKECGFRLVMVGSRDARISKSFSNIPLAEGIRRLVGHHSVAIIYEMVDTTGDRKGTQDIKEVWVFDSTETGAGDPVLETQKEDQETDVVVITRKSGSPDDPGTISPQDPDIIGIKATTTHAPFDMESEVGYWANMLVDNAHRAVREQAITELQLIGSEAAANAISMAFSDEDAGIRRHAVESLSNMDIGNVAPLVGQALLGDKDPSVRLSAVRYFARQSNEISRAFLNKAIKDKDPKVSAVAREALADN